MRWSITEGVAEDLAHGVEEVLLPAELDLLDLLVGGDLDVVEDDVALVFVGFLQDDFDHGVLLPVAELPLHLDVLPGFQGEVLAHDLAVQHLEFSVVDGLDCGLGSRVLHDFPGWGERYMLSVRAS